MPGQQEYCLIMNPLFACERCGCPAVKLPEELSPEAMVSCRACNQPIATWEVFKERMTQIIVAETGRPQTARQDPLCFDYDKGSS